MVDYITPVVEAWVNNVFGDVLIASAIFMFFFVLWGIKRGWSMELIGMVMIPFLFVMTTVGGLPPVLWLIVSIIIALLAGLALIRLIRR